MSSEPIKPRTASLGVRLNLWFATVIAGVSLAVFFAAYHLLASAVRQKDRDVILAELQTYSAWYRLGGLAELRRQFGDLDVGRKEVFFVRVNGPASAGLFLNVPQEHGFFDLELLAHTNADESLTWLKLPATSDGAPWLIATQPLHDGNWLQVGKTTEAQAALLEHFRVVFTEVMLLALVLGVGMGLMLTHNTLRPIRQLIGAFQRVIQTGKMDVRVDPGPVNDELSQITRLFNQMLERNDALIRGMREALDNVAHDLRTPLTRLRNTTERALQRSHNVETLRNALSDTLEEAENVSLTLNTLMDISEAETGIMKLEKTDLKLAELVSTVVGIYELVIEDKEIKITVNVPEAVHCHADRGRLQQVLVNLLDNALKYTPTGGSVEISASESTTETVINVSDTGPGIPVSEIPRIWERLYRCDKSRAEHGLGLGLSLVRAVVQAHGGTVEVQSQPGIGATFRVTLPALRQA